MDDVERRYRGVLDRAQADPNVLGVILSGSRVADEFVTPHSDFDCWLILNAPDEVSWPFIRGSGIETVTATLEQFDEHARVGTATFWNRPSFLFARLEIDKRNGEIEALLDAKRRLALDEADALVHESAGAYINSLYRSLKNLRDGRALAGRLDAVESLSPLLTLVFALEGRVRPFSKWLARELDRAPLPIARFLARVEQLLESPDASTQQAMFRDVETVMRGHGYVELVDDWHPDVPFLRGEGSD